MGFQHFKLKSIREVKDDFEILHSPKEMTMRSIKTFGNTSLMNSNSLFATEKEEFQPPKIKKNILFDSISDDVITIS